MNNWFLFVMVSCLACSASSTTPDPVTATDGPYRVTAQLNDSTWFGAAHASKSVSLTNGTTCVTNRIDISFVTDLSYSGTTPQQTITGCLQDCVPTQQLVFYRIPLTIGKYELTDLTTCAPPQEAVIYTLLLGGDAVVNTFSSGPNTKGWMEITGYDQRQNVIEGAFEVEVADKTGKMSRFKRGVFRAVVIDT